MNKKAILLIIFTLTIALTLANVLISEGNSEKSFPKTMSIGNKTVTYEKEGKCLDVIDGNTIQVYGVGKVQLTQIGSPTNEAKQFVEEKCLGKTVYLNIDDKQPKDEYKRTLAIVYTNTTDINKELIENNLAEISYFTPSEFKKGEI